MEDQTASAWATFKEITQAMQRELLRETPDDAADDCARMWSRADLQFVGDTSQREEVTLGPE
jgi:hypothetical protein